MKSPKETVVGAGDGTVVDPVVDVDVPVVAEDVDVVVGAGSGAAVGVDVDVDVVVAVDVVPEFVLVDVSPDVVVPDEVLQFVPSTHEPLVALVVEPDGA